MTTALKSVCIVVAVFGLLTAGVCIWIMAVPVKMTIAGALPAYWDGKDPPKLGIATAVLMMLVGISACFINLEKRFIIFVAALFVLLILAIAFMSLAIKDHGDWKNLEQAQKIHLSFGGSSLESSQFQTARNLIIDKESLDAILTRLKILAAAGGIDMVILLISLIIFYMKRPKGSSRNVMQMERTL